MPVEDNQQRYAEAARLILEAKPLKKGDPTDLPADILTPCRGSPNVRSSREMFTPEGYVALEIPINKITEIGPPAGFTDGGLEMGGAMHRLGLEIKDWNAGFLATLSEDGLGRNTQGMRIVVEEEAYRAMLLRAAGKLVDPVKGSDLLGYDEVTYRELMKERDSDPRIAVANAIAHGRPSVAEVNALMGQAAAHDMHELASSFRDQVNPGKSKVSKGEAMPERNNATVKNAMGEDLPNQGAMRLVLAAKIIPPGAAPSIVADEVYPYTRFRGSHDHAPVTREEFTPPGHVTFEIPQAPLYNLVSHPSATDGSVYVGSALADLGVPADKTNIGNLSKNHRRAGIRVTMDEDAFRAMSRKAAMDLVTPENGSAMLGYTPQGYNRLMNAPGSEPFTTALNVVEQAKMEMRDLKDLISIARQNGYGELAKAISADIDRARGDLGRPTGPRQPG